MCPQCGQTDSVLQSLCSDDFECRPELGGCGAVFDKPPADSPANADSVRVAIDAMREAICDFEHAEYPMGLESMLQVRGQVESLLEKLKQEIGRIAIAVDE